MSPKASSDFGLYKERQKTRILTPGKITTFVVISVLFFGGITFALVHMIEPVETPSAHAEKLSRQMFPKPFGLTYRGQQPAEFTTTTESVTTLHHPQAGVRTRYFPNNIQEVIGYTNYHPKRYYKQASSQYVPKNFTGDNDPFYFFKPQDPGDVNLLSTGSFRFAPPSWINNRKIPRIYNTKRNEVGKPVSLTLNVFPNKEREQHGLKQFISQRIENFQSRVGFPGNKAKKMVIHLNLYPQDQENQRPEEQALIT